MGRLLAAGLARRATGQGRQGRGPTSPDGGARGTCPALLPSPPRSVHPLPRRGAAVAPVRGLVGRVCHPVPGRLRERSTWQGRQAWQSTVQALRAVRPGLPAEEPSRTRAATQGAEAKPCLLTKARLGPVLASAAAVSATRQAAPAGDAPSWSAAKHPRSR